MRVHTEPADRAEEAEAAAAVVSRLEVVGCLEVLFKQLMRIGEAEVAEALADGDLSFTQVRVLFTLTRVGEPLAINELAARIGQSVAAAGRNIDCLVGSGLVERNEDPTDRRVKLVSISARGREVVDHKVTARRNALQVFVETLPAGQTQSLLEALRPIVADLDPTTCGSSPNQHEESDV